MLLIVMNKIEIKETTFEQETSMTSFSVVVINIDFIYSDLVDHLKVGIR